MASCDDKKINSLQTWRYIGIIDAIYDAEDNQHWRSILVSYVLRVVAEKTWMEAESSKESEWAESLTVDRVRG